MKKFFFLIIIVTNYCFITNAALSQDCGVTINPETGGNPINVKFVPYISSSLGTLKYFIVSFGDGESQTGFSLESFYHTYSEAGSYDIVFYFSTYKYTCKGIYYGKVVVEESTDVKNIEHSTVPSFSVSPNPVYDKMTIKYNLDKYQNVEIIITDVLGVEYAKFSNSEKIFSEENIIEYDTSHLASGVYFCTIRCENYVKTIKCFVIR